MNLLKLFIDDYSKKPKWSSALARAKVKFGKVNVNLALQNEERKVYVKEIRLERKIKNIIEKILILKFKQSIGIKKFIKKYLLEK